MAQHDMNIANQSFPSFIPTRHRHKPRCYRTSTALHRRTCASPTLTPRISPCSLYHENAQPLPPVSPKLSRAISRSFNDQAYSITDAPLKSAASYLFESDGTAQTKHFFGLGQSRLRSAYAH